MIVRVVRLHFQPEHADRAAEYVTDVAPKVRRMPGCTHLEILRDVHRPSRFTTYSHWDSEADLNTYRYSPVFKTFWGKVKPLFSQPANAWSATREHLLP